MTDSDGRYIISFLQPGPYEVSVTATGFGALTRPNIAVEIGRTTSVDLKVALAGQAQQVDVVAETPVINTESE